MQSMDESFARVREAPDLDELVGDGAWAAETDPEDSGDSDEVDTDSTLPLKRPPSPSAW